MENQGHTHQYDWSDFNQTTFHTILYACAYDFVRMFSSVGGLSGNSLPTLSPITVLPPSQTIA